MVIFSLLLEQLDKKILEALQRDARLSSRQIAEKLGVAAGTVNARMRKLREQGVLRGFRPEIDWDVAGYDITAVILVRVEGGKLVEVENKLANNKNICLVYDMTGDYDVALVGKFRDRAQLNRFIKSALAMDHIERTVTSIVLNVVKEEFALPI
jgi:DNA-binding Lrp family transcriptional regulator|tara:strand:- start:941 stop:1402 length:462 start_codon:yes stop_codon:yes gene_type:complete